MLLIPSSACYYNSQCSFSVFKTEVELKLHTQCGYLTKNGHCSSRMKGLVGSHVYFEKLTIFVVIILVPCFPYIRSN